MAHEDHNIVPLSTFESAVIGLLLDETVQFFTEARDLFQRNPIINHEFTDAYAKACEKHQLINNIIGQNALGLLLRRIREQ